MEFFSSLSYSGNKESQAGKIEDSVKTDEGKIALEEDENIELGRQKEMEKASNGLIGKRGEPGYRNTAEQG